MMINSCSRKCSECGWNLTISDPIDAHDLNYDIQQVYCLLNGNRLAAKCNALEAENLIVTKENCPILAAHNEN